ncbi:endonuclease/exonuclease/phosphatase family protein [Nocardioides sp. cx-173]|uniref:endonuclease/exonuclease/phosphatase family protein n=1 Tax=Nocardioides sp. cx-173 TaxID=2898796 RepID=UPI001E62A3BA|nr:endonuclease/exonuclease/phosphatase family protein [Nocardioides sp. cx-173]MCD4526240.1 endonuclease/exonuclease/phosphatase family protein [Nocardioides sp. cx-173]UGB40550.1 endonuclease/exonuclease/phosphatase family protein [Nocardioides sp. cx-173]
MRISRAAAASAAAFTLLTTSTVAGLSAGSASAGPASAERGHPRGHGHHGHDRHDTVRFQTFNASLNRARAGELVEDLATPDDPQAAAVAEIIQRTRPDVLLLNEFDYVPGGAAVDLFREHYLEVAQDGARPIHYRYAYVAPSNTGVPSGHDLDNNGSVGGGNDAFGFGDFEGQYGMVVLSRHPIVTSRVRTFQRFLWKDLPGAMLPDDPATAAPRDWYSPAELEDVRLSSKSHWDVPVRVGRRTVHFLVSHPTPPTFDGAEDRNGARNHDEIRFWADYVDGRRYFYDDQGRRGGLARGERFVVAGDQNSDPADGDSVAGAIQQLLDHPRVQDPRPSSRGAVEAAALQGGANAAHESDPRFDTADFSDVPAPGNLRADYVLPSRGLKVRAAGVFWPVRADPLSRLTGEYPFPSSDHRAVWIDLRL